MNEAAPSSCETSPTIGAVRWAEVARRLRPYLLRQLRSEADADDVLQEVLIKMHDGLGALRDEERLVSWAYGIARRAIVDHARARGRRPITSKAAVDAPAGPPDEERLDPPLLEDPEQGLVAVIAQFVAALPSPYREAIVLTELEGRSQREAAQMLGVSHTAMKSRVQRGRAKLRASLERCCAIELDARNRVIGVEPRPDAEVPEGCCEDGCA